MTEPKLIVDVNIEAGAWQAAVPELSTFIERALAAALKTVDDLPGEVEVSVLLTDDAHQQVLNAQWRGKDKPTNVLSFPSGEDAPHPGQPKLLGDISLAFETLGREAQDQQKSLADHLCHLLVHGMLHLLGFDHETQQDADEMEPLEIEVLAGLGISSPYGDRA